MAKLSVPPWCRQVTTGIGAIIGTPAAIAIITHQVTLQQGWPALLAAAIAILWPENPQAQQTLVTAAEELEKAVPLAIALFRHLAVAPPPVVPVVTPAPTPAPAPPTPAPASSPISPAAAPELRAGPPTPANGGPQWRA